MGIQLDFEKYKITLLEEALGTASGNPELHHDYIASKAPDKALALAEVDAVTFDADEVERKAMTVFPRNGEGWPCLYDYQMKGFFKDSCKMLRKVTGSKSSKVKAYRQDIDGSIFVRERMVPFVMPDGSMPEVGRCERPLRASTPQGERVALAASETVPAGCTLTLTVMCLRPGMFPWIHEMMDYGALRGLCQWRNSGKGRFSYEVIGHGKAGSADAEE